MYWEVINIILTMNIQLICSDIDGTLLNIDRELSKKTIEEIKRVAPTPFILISSRMPKAMTHLQKELNISHLPLIAYNGGLIIDNGHIINSTEISIETIKKIYLFIQNTKLHLSLYHNDEWFVPEMDYWAKREANNTKVIPTIQNIETTLHNWKHQNKGAHKIMIMGDENKIDSLVTYLNKNLSSKVIGYRSKNTYLEIAHKSINKKTAIETLINSYYPKLNLENVLAFGDNYNDVEMLKNVGIGVAVQNAKDEVISIANEITLTNIEDGVALYLKNKFK